MSSTLRFIEESRCSDNYNNADNYFCKICTSFTLHSAWRFLWNVTSLLKIFAIMMIAILSLGTLASCGKKKADLKKLKIVATAILNTTGVRDSRRQSHDVDLEATSEEYWFGTAAFSSGWRYFKGHFRLCWRWVRMNGLRTFPRRKRTSDLVAQPHGTKWRTVRRLEEVKEGMQPEKEDAKVTSSRKRREVGGDEYNNSLSRRLALPAYRAGNC